MFQSSVVSDTAQMLKTSVAYVVLYVREIIMRRDVIIQQT